MSQNTITFDAALSRHQSALSLLTELRVRDRSPHRDSLSGARLNLALTEATAFLDQLYGVTKALDVAAERARNDQAKASIEQKNRRRKEVAQIFGGDLKMQECALDMYDRGQSSLDSAEEFLRVVSSFQPFQQAWKERDRARRFHRVANALLEGALGLVVGVIVVELISDKLETIDRWAAWGFAVVAWAVLDYVLTPVLERWHERQTDRLVTKALQTAGWARNNLIKSTSRGAKDPIWTAGWR